MKFIDLLIVMVVIALIVVIASNAYGYSTGTHYYGGTRGRSWSSVNVYHWGSGSYSTGGRASGYRASSTGTGVK